MLVNKTEIIEKLKKDILLLQGMKTVSGNHLRCLEVIKSAFPGERFPVAAVHELICDTIEDMAATSGFLAALLNNLVQSSGVCVWIGGNPMVYPPALKIFGIEPDRVLFINLAKDIDVLWVVEEALKCEAITAVVGQVRELNFDISRRLQLAVERSRATGFLLRFNPRFLQNTACVARWHVSPLPSQTEDMLPGLGTPRWHVRLSRIRNGKPGVWSLEWNEDHFRLMPESKSVPEIGQERKTG